MQRKDLLNQIGFTVEPHAHGFQLGIRIIISDQELFLTEEEVFKIILTKHLQQGFLDMKNHFVEMQKKIDNFDETETPKFWGLVGSVGRDGI